VTINHRIVNPGAALIIWNYNERLSAADSNAATINKIDEVILNTVSLISMATSKSKSTPAGSFECRLAPTVNWTARITPGSWCAILMSQDPLTAIDKHNVGKADSRTLKMIGRIDAVHQTVDVNQETGARSTAYIVTGRDWGSVFDTQLYIDPITRNNSQDSLGPLGHSQRILADNMFLEWAGDKKLPSSSEIVDAIINVWGSPISDLSKALNNAVSNSNSKYKTNSSNPQKLSGALQLSSEAQFKLPKEVANYMQGSSGGASVNFAEIIDRQHGVLVKQDTYGGDPEEAHGYPDPASLYGMHSFWQVLVDNSNPILYEMFPDIRWTGDKPKFTLYHRIRPFVNRAASDIASGSVSELVSPFKYVRQIDIPLNDVLTISSGTNWRDKINFIELRPQPQLVPELFQAEAKLESQIIDKPAYEREGFKPMIQEVYYMPYNDKTPVVLAAMKWRHLMREWYFNTHIMLSGSINFIGQDKYIQVGDNIKIDASILGEGKLSSRHASATTTTYLLAHVEAIRNNFSVDPESGARTFITTVSFVRGVITDAKGNLIGAGGGGSSLPAGLPSVETLVQTHDTLSDSPANTPDGALDAQANKAAPVDKKNSNVFGTSNEKDPDIQKLKGS